MRKLLLLASVIIAGCATQKPQEIKIPMPAPRMNVCAGIVIGDKCRPLTAGTVGGTTLGNTNENIVEENSR